MSVEEDLKRFNNIVKGKIKQDFKKYIKNKDMIGKRENDFVKIPLPSIELPRFKYGKKESGGVGQGDGQPQEGKDGQQQPGQGEAGNGPGEHTIEAEVSLDELAEIMGEELELPRIEPRGKHNISADKYSFNGRGPIGPDSLRHFKSSYKEALKRSIASGTYDPKNPYVIPIKKDFRYRTMKTVSKPQTKAVVIYIMDVSGSMGEEQKEIVRLESFWINTWLKKNYSGLETRFIIHDAGAREVDEKTFFSTSESGGTLISSAYKLCKQMILKDYNPSEWNIYPFHFSDGDNWSGDDSRICMELLKGFFLPNVNMFCYGQVESKYGSGQFIKELDKEFGDDERIVRSQIENKDKIITSIKTFLGKGK